MRLHEMPNEFKNLISIVSKEKHLPELAIEKDYYIVLLLKNLADSEYSDLCVFKGGTSLSKCYPGSIERFSEDIDLTFLGMGEPDNKCDKMIKKIEKVITVGANTEKIVAERSSRSKSMYVWFNNQASKIKLEIGSSIRPDPYFKKTLKTYIQEFLEERGEEEDIRRYELEEVSLNVLSIERTFIDKIMSVKRHAICGTIKYKVRHIYDVTRLFEVPEIQQFLTNKESMRELVKKTKETDLYYLNKRGITEEYNPKDKYDFDSWKKYLNSDIRKTYEILHKTLLYTDEVQSFDKAMETFQKINDILNEIDE